MFILILNLSKFFLYICSIIVLLLQAPVVQQKANDIDWGQSSSAMDWSQPVSRFDDELKLDLTMSDSSSDANDSDKENDKNFAAVSNLKVDAISNSTTTLVSTTKNVNASLVQGW